MKSYEIKPTKENIIKTILDDSIGRVPDVCSFITLLSSIDGEYSIGLDGKWGTGKTIFIKQTQLLLDALNPITSFSKTEEAKNIILKTKNLDKSFDEDDISFVTAYYDAWQHDDEDEPLLSLIYEIMKDNLNNENITNKSNWGEIIGDIADTVTKLNISDFIKNIKGKDLLEQQRKNEELNNLVEQFFKSLLPENGNKLVIFIDELDRCNPIFAVKLLERVKHFCSLENVIFVFTINFKELEHSINSLYGEKFDSCRYLERFFDFRMQLPPIDMARFFKTLNVGDYSNLRISVCKELIRQLNMGMRDTSKLLHLTKTAAYKFTDSNIKTRSYRDGGISRLIGFSVIVPIALALKMNNSSEYDDFISGRDAFWFEKIILSESLDDWITKFFLRDDETYKNDETYNSERNLVYVSKKDKIKSVYDAFFVNTYEENDKYCVTIGKGYYDINLKNSIMRAISMVSEYSNY